MTDHRHTAVVAWSRGGADFLDGKYSRAHEWRFDGGVTVPAGASPSVVPVPLTPEAAVDPEEAYVAALASCHMLTFIDLARRKGLLVDSYEDAAEGTMARLEARRWWVDRVALRPRVTFGGDTLPSDEDIAALHHAAHELCFIANSVRTEISVEPASD